MSDKKYCIVGLGELLWDLFPAGKQLGGAPANFAYCSNLLGDRGFAASRVGNDELGTKVLAKLSELDLKTSFIQVDDVHPTGTVKVRVDAKGEPAFEIMSPVAWDFLAWEPSLQSLAKEADAVCFGSLAQRSQRARETIRAFLAAVRPATVRIFDVNLRQSFYSEEVLSQSVQLTDILKLNHEELPRVAKILGLVEGGREEACAKQLLDRYALKLVCVTRGAWGSLLASRNETDQHPGFHVTVADAVGAGDAFTAAMVHHFLRGSSLATMNVAANRMGAWVASHAGATPPGEPDEVVRVRTPSI
jgi:fructokinase